MKIAVIGSGYVGLVAGACFAHSGNQVTCVDVDVKKIEGLRNGIIPIFEPGLDELVLNNVAAGRLHFTTSTAEGVAGAAAVFIAVGTPPQEDGSADLSRVLQVARSIADGLTDYAVIVTKSTVPIGTNAKVHDILAAHAKVSFDVASNPEFLKEGAALDDFLKPDRVVIGTATARARAVLHELYLPFVERAEQIIFMDIRSAEMTKYAANAMLATRISFMNEVANLCEKVGADVTEVKRGIGTDSRIGMAFLNAGIGYGGSCFPKDVKALMMTGRQNGFAMEILSAVESVNDQQKSVLARKVQETFGASLAGKRIALLGLAFKPDTDDMREAPALVIARTLTRDGAVLVG